MRFVISKRVKDRDGRANKRVTEEFQDSRPKSRNFLLDSLSDEAKEQVKDAGGKESVISAQSYKMARSLLQSRNE